MTLIRIRLLITVGRQIFNKQTNRPDVYRSNVSRQIKYLNQFISRITRSFGTAVYEFQEPATRKAMGLTHQPNENNYLRKILKQVPIFDQSDQIEIPDTA